MCASYHDAHVSVCAYVQYASSACVCVRMYVCMYVVVAYVCMCSFIYHHLCSHVFFRMHRVCLYMIECAGRYILFVCACVVSVCIMMEGGRIYHDVRSCVRICMYV